MKISHKVPLLASTSILIGFAILTFVLYRMESDYLYATATRAAVENAQAVSDQTVTWLNGKLNLIDMMGNYIAEEYSAEQIQKVMDNPLLEGEFSLIFGCLDTDGKPISNTPSWNPGDTWDGRVRPWYGQARKAEHAVLTPPYIDSATGRLLLSVVGNIKDKNTFKGAFGGDVELTDIVGVVNNISFDEKGYAFLLDKEGVIISHPDNSLAARPITAVFPDISQPKEGGFVETSVDDQTFLVKFIPLNLDNRDADWFIAVVLDKSKVMASVERLKIVAVAVALISALLTSLILYFAMARLLLNPIERLTRTAEQISLGKFDTKVQGTERKDEIGLLAKAVDRMGVSIKMAMDKLKKM